MGGQEPAAPRARPVITVLRWAVDVRPDELAALLWSGLYFFVVLATNYILRPVRDEMGLVGGTRNLPWLFWGTLTAVLLTQPLFAALVSRFPRRQFIPWTYRFFALNLLAFCAGFLLLPQAGQVNLGRAFFIWMSVFNLFVVSVFWGFMADLFSSGQGKRLFGFIGAGGTLGGIVGSEVVKQFGGHPGPATIVGLFVCGAVLLEVAVQCVQQLGRLQLARAAARPAGDRAAGCDAALARGGALGGFTAVFRSPYLLGIAAYILLMTVSSTFLYFQQQEFVNSTITERGARLRFFAQIDQFTNVATLLLQTLVVGHIIPLIGVGASAALLPLLTAGGFLLVLVHPAAGTFMLAQVARRTAEYGLTRPAREVLYTVVPRADKYKAKTFIDTFVYRGGDALGAWWFRLLGGAAQFGAITAIVVPAAAVWAALSLWLGRQQQRRAAPQPRGDPAMVPQVDAH